MTTPREPTFDEIRAHAKVDGGWACWYPQMGGYVAKAVVVRDGDCWNVYVWHNGDFPFSGMDERWPGEPVPSPSELHHCDAEQFIGFGQFLQSLEGE
jgi:hypothetical protein